MAEGDEFKIDERVVVGPYGPTHARILALPWTHEHPQYSHCYVVMLDDGQTGYWTEHELDRPDVVTQLGDVVSVDGAQA